MALPSIPDVKSPFTEEQTAKAWDECAQILQSHSDQMIARWKAEIDMLLVFAGLFSAVLTAFNVQSYVLLQPDTTGASLLVLTQISTQLSSFTATPTAINSTRPAFVLPPDSSFKPPPSAVWINALWFSSLICTLSASSLAIMVKQWLHQYDEGLSGTSRNVTRLRQYRYGNLLKWRIVGIIALIPVLLQASLALFLAGLVILLWTIHPAVATVISVLAGLLLLFIIFSTVIPTFRADCPYQSPQALSIYIASQFVARIMARMASILSVKVACLLEPLEIRHGWRFAVQLRGRCDRMSRWLSTWLAARSKIRWWRAREQARTRSMLDEIDEGLAIKAYELTLDDAFLNMSVTPCIWRLDPGHVVRCSNTIIRIRTGIDIPLPDSTVTWRPILPFILAVGLKMTQAIDDSLVHRAIVFDLLPPMLFSFLDGSADTPLGQQFLHTMSSFVLRGVNSSALWCLLRYLARETNKDMHIEWHVFLQGDSASDSMQWKQSGELAMSKNAICDTFPGVRALMSQFSHAHTPIRDNPEKAPGRSQYYESAFVDTLLFLNTFLTCSPWKENEGTWECISRTLHRAKLFPLSEDDLRQGSPMCVATHLNVIRTLDATFRFLADNIPSYQSPPWLDHMRAIGRYCEVRIAGAAASKSPPTIVAPATSDATLVATPQCDVRQSLPLLAVPDGPTYLHIHESALSIDAPHGPIPHSTPSICNTDTDVAPTGLIDQSNDSERAERPV